MWIDFSKLTGNSLVDALANQLGPFSAIIKNDENENKIKLSFDGGSRWISISLDMLCDVKKISNVTIGGDIYSYVQIWVAAPTNEDGFLFSEIAGMHAAKSSSLQQKFNDLVSNRIRINQLLDSFEDGPIHVDPPPRN